MKSLLTLLTLSTSIFAQLTCTMYMSSTGNEYCIIDQSEKTMKHSVSVQTLDGIMLSEDTSLSFYSHGSGNGTYLAYNMKFEGTSK